MIVMKFGGSSLESPEAISRVCGIVRGHVAEHPVVVVSAIGHTTDQLLSIAEQASQGKGYQARKTLQAVQDAHFRMADDLVRGVKLDLLERSLQKSFRELQGLVHDLCEDGRELTPELLDAMASFGERLSSEIVAGALLQAGVPAVHVDSREFVVTDGRHGAAAPLLWETYARMRRSIPALAEQNVVVMGGFIGATEDGVTTTLGRGGSDLTASLVGAGIAADLIEIWTDVDGMLTCDPRILQSVHRVRSLSFEEATALARAGAKVLHPETVQPAVRQGIPLSIRNSRRPEIEGTRIEPSSPCTAGGIKAIGVKQNLLILEVASSEFPAGPELLAKIAGVCERKGFEPALLVLDGDRVVLGVASVAAFEPVEKELFSGCAEIHMHPDAAVLSLVGGGVCADSKGVAGRVRSALKGMGVTVLAGGDAEPVVRVIVEQNACHRACYRLHREFFGKPDTRHFAPVADMPANAPDAGLQTLAIASPALHAKYAELRLRRL